MFGLQEQEIYQLKKIFKKFEIDKVILFGSRAKGAYKEGSDIDFALISKELRFGDILDIDLEIDRLNMPYRVDMVDFKKIKNSDLKEHILKVGKTFFEQDFDDAKEFCTYEEDDPTYKVAVNR